VWGKGEGGKWILQSELEGHTGSVWKVGWAHPIYGTILASCSADKTVKIWEEHVDPEAKKPWIWKRRAQFLESRESVECIEFAPKHLGLKLATGSSDGWIRIYKTENQLDVAHWQCENKFLIRPLKDNTSLKNMGDEESMSTTTTTTTTSSGDVGLTCLSWSRSQFDDAMIVVGCASGSPQIWGYNKSFRKWQLLIVLEGHTGPILDVSWAPKLGRSYHLIASASQDKTIRIWKVKVGNGEVKVVDQWVLDDHKAEVWSVEWNMTGTMLASTGDDGKAKVWKYAAGGRWVCNRDL
jgi:nucleoporin SEH1